MQIRDLIPWGRSGTDLADKSGGQEGAMLTLQRDVNRVFEDFWSRFDRPFGFGLGFGGPRADVAETDDKVEVTIELPGLEEKDVEVSLTDDALTVRGEKRAEREEARKGFHLAERSYGSFQRTIPLPAGVDADKASATFRQGVLTVSVPRTPEAKAKVRRIEVNAA